MNYQNYVFDFDCTIAKLVLDWALLKIEVNNLCRKHNFSLDQSLNMKIDQLKTINCNVLEILLRHEQPNGAIHLIPIQKTLTLIRSLPQYSIISNNHSSTVKKSVEKLGISQNCQKIIGIDIVAKSKPNPESFRLVRPTLKEGTVVYVGDRISDKVFASNASIHFLDIKNL